MKHTSYIEVSKNALKNNIGYIRKKIGKKTILNAVVKGNAYGHGIEHFVPLAQQCGINHFAVFSANEANRVHKVVKPGSGIMILGMIADEDLDWAIQNQVQFYVFEFERLKAAIETAKKLQQKAVIHIELETGMHRLGFEENEIPDIINLIKNNENYIEVEGICTHYAGAESISNFIRIKEQIDQFKKLNGIFEENGIHARLKHTACSAATLNFPETIMDMVRVGISLYGFWPSPECFVYQFKDVEKKIKDPLKRVISWKSQIMSIKEVKKGDFVGYGTSYLASRNTKLAIVPVGYAYGYSRNLSNLGHVLIHGRRNLVIGIVNMNLMIVDISELHQPKKGDEVVLIGKQGKQSITVASFSELSQQLNYELLTRLPPFIPRYIVE